MEGVQSTMVIGINMVRGSIYGEGRVLYAIGVAA